MLLDQMTGFFKSAFYFPGTSWLNIFVAVVVGLIFGAIWLSLYRPPLFKQSHLWIIAGASAILTWTAIAFVQIPLQYWCNQLIAHLWDQFFIMKWIYFLAIPVILLSGIVQEAAKLAPVLFYRWRSKIDFTPKTGLIAGAVSGAGFGIFEAIWVNNQIFTSGVSWTTVNNGFWGLWERLFAVAFHIALAAFTGYGIAKRKTWQFYLVAAFLHGLMNYSIILLQKGVITSVQDEMLTAIFAVLVTGFALWLCWRKTKVTGSTDSADISNTTAYSEPPAVS